MKTVKEVLTAHREFVINYYNTEIKNNWNVSLKEFMLDVMNNFEKVTKSDGYRLMDVSCNCMEAKSRLGLMDTKVEVGFDRDAYRKSKAPNGQWMAII